MADKKWLIGASDDPPLHLDLIKCKDECSPSFDIQCLKCSTYHKAKQSWQAPKVAKSVKD